MSDKHTTEKAEKARSRAIDRLATITGESTPERRRNHAEWIVDALMDAIRADMSTPPGNTTTTKE